MDSPKILFSLHLLVIIIFLIFTVPGNGETLVRSSQASDSNPLYAQGPSLNPAENSPPSPPEDQAEPSISDPSDAQKALQTPEDQPQAATSTDAGAAQVLKGPSRLQIEITESYAHYSSNQLFIDGFGIIPILAVGDIRIERVRRDIFTTQVSTRYRMTDRLQISFSVPHTTIFSRVSLVKDNTLVSVGTVGPNEERIAKSAGLGDIEASLSYQLLIEKYGRPGVLVGLGVRLRTGRDFFETVDATVDPPLGSGYNGIIGTISLVKTADPALLFGSLSLVYAVPRNDVLFNNNGNPVIVDFDPGHSIRWGIGMAYALNFRLNLSLQFSQAITFPSRINGEKNPNSFANALSMRIGGVWRFNDITSVDVGVSPGFSLDAPDVRFDVRIPYRF